MDKRTIAFVDNEFLKKRYATDSLKIDWEALAKEYDAVYAYIKSPTSSRGFVEMLRKLDINVSATGLYVSEYFLSVFANGVNGLRGTQNDYHVIASDPRLEFVMARALMPSKESLMFFAGLESAVTYRNQSAYKGVHWRPLNYLDYLFTKEDL